jgi:prepilin-type N-terminal cleavage/methylation domain-containing protein
MAFKTLMLFQETNRWTSVPRNESLDNRKRTKMKSACKSSSHLMLAAPVRPETSGAAGIAVQSCHFDPAQRVLPGEGRARKMAGGGVMPVREERSGGFTLVEVMVVMALVTVLITGCFGSILCMKLIARRTADYTAGMGLAEAKIHDIRATTYDKNTAVFSTTTTRTNTDSVSVALNNAGTSFKVPGTIISTIKPIAWGHLITVTVVIREANLYLTNTLQTVVNSYSGGRGQ